MPGTGATLEPSRATDGKPADRCATGLVRDLSSGRKKVAVWGLGYLGYHNLVRLLTQRVNCVVTDRVMKRLARVSAPGFVDDVLRNCYGFGVAETGQGCVTAEACEPAELAARRDVGAHLICVPTEKDGRPSDEPLSQVMQALAQADFSGAGDPVLIVVESSGAPGAIDRVVLPALQQAGAKIGERVFVGAAPRTDYGRSPFENQAGSVRVAGGVTCRCGAMLARFYGMMGEPVRLAATHREAELACAVHRGAQHLLMSYVNQLALAFGETDVRQTVDLAATIGSLALHAPGLGSSGYFLPVSANHLRDSAGDPDMLTLLDEAFRCDLMMAGVVADRLVEAGVQRLAILGLSTVADAKNHIHSPVLRLLRLFRGRLAEVFVCDPYYSDHEVMDLTGCPLMHWPAESDGCDGVLVVTGHRAFRTTDPGELADRLRGSKLVLDCCGAWADKRLPEAGLKYFVLGQAGWAG
jgi:UDP-N-acetyl-D-mannosaminuronate dehydrogenase